MLETNCKESEIGSGRRIATIGKFGNCVIFRVIQNELVESILRVTCTETKQKHLNRSHLEKSSKVSQKKRDKRFFGFPYIFICTKIREILCQYVENILLYS